MRPTHIPALIRNLSLRMSDRFALLHYWYHIKRQAAFIHKVITTSGTDGSWERLEMICGRQFKQPYGP